MRLVTAMCAILIALAVALPAAAIDTRCGLSTSLTGGVSVPYNAEVHNEFDYMFIVEADLKYYLFWGVSISGATGFHYASGDPERVHWHGEWHDYDNRGRSFWRAWPNYGTLKIELARNYRFNPYIGGGAGASYVYLYRKGYVFYEPISNGHGEWMPFWHATAGFDIAFTKYVAFRFDGKYRVQPSQHEYYKGLDFGGWDFLTGVNIYF